MAASRPVDEPIPTARWSSGLNPAASGREVDRDQHLGTLTADDGGDVAPQHKTLRLARRDAQGLDGVDATTAASAAFPSLGPPLLRGHRIEPASRR